MGNLDNKIAIVTGAASGIGRATAEAFAAEGATVVLTDIQGPEGKEVTQRINKAGGKAVFHVQNVVDEAVWQELIASTVAEFGGLDILVNNAGIAPGGPITETSLADWTNLMEVNVDSVFLGTKHAVPAMIASGGGSIINISSVADLKGAPGLTAYNATKGAVRLFTKGVAKEYAKEGVRINSVHPGIIDTAIWAKMDDSLAESFIPRTEGANEVDVEGIAGMMNVPMGHAGKPQEIAAGIVFLASDASSHMTGSELVIDGGMTA